jgi:hypothetical protein
MLRRVLIVSSLALLLAGPAAGGGTIIVKLTFVPGKLSVKSAPAATAPGGVAVPVTIADGRGNGNGWTLKVSSAQPVTVLGITARCAAGSTCTLPTASSGPSGSIVLRAARDTGMGVMNLVVTLAGPSGTPVSFTVS